MPHEPKRPRIVSTLVETFGFSPALASIVIFLFALLAFGAAVWVLRSAPPRTLVITSGPAGSTFQRWADLYQKELAVEGVTLEILPSGGSLDNLQRLQAAGGRADIGFVAGGIAEGISVEGLSSLGSVAYQPLLLFYRSPQPIERLGELAGKRVAVGAPGSGTRTLSLRLLSANGVTGAPTAFSDLDAEKAAAGLLEGSLDAIFLMGDSASLQTLRSLIRVPEVRLFDFQQADAYVRRYPYLNKISLPEGSFDLGRNLPTQDTDLVGPTVELVAREGLNSALCDLILEVAQKVHGQPNVLQKKGEFPAPLEHEFILNEDALRFYKSGKGFLYRMIDSFWLANLANRLLVVVVPLILLLIPIFRFLPAAYQLGVRLRFYKYYRPLLRLERETFTPLTAERIAELQKRLAEIEEHVDRLKVPASFADQFYELKLHLAYVKQRLAAAAPK